MVDLGNWQQEEEGVDSGKQVVVVDLGNWQEEEGVDLGKWQEEEEEVDSGNWQEEEGVDSGNWQEEEGVDSGKQAVVVVLGKLVVVLEEVWVDSARLVQLHRTSIRLIRCNHSSSSSSLEAVGNKQARVAHLLIHLQ